MLIRKCFFSIAEFVIKLYYKVKRNLVTFVVFILLQINNMCSAHIVMFAEEPSSYASLQNNDIYSNKHIIDRAQMLLFCVPDHSQVSSNAKPYMTVELYSALKVAWDVPHWYYGGIGDEDFLYYFVTGNGGGSINKNSIISTDVLSKSDNKCRVRIKYREYEENQYYDNSETIELLMHIQDGDWVLADFGLGALEECKNYIKNQVENYKSGNIVKEMKSSGHSQNQINDACSEFETFLSIYSQLLSIDNNSTIPYHKTTSPPSFKGEGLDSFIRWVLGCTKYPDYCKEEGVEGDIKVKFTVDENGFVIDESIIKGVEPSLDAEALRIISTCPQWCAGKYYFNDVRTQIELTIPFRISNLNENITNILPSLSNSTTPSLQIF